MDAAIAEAAVPAADVAALEAALDAEGWAPLPGLLDRGACERVRALYDDDARFRSTVVMARHGYGRGAYRYFAYPLPDLVARLRGALYERLAPIANRWNDALRSPVRYPARH